MNLLETLLNGNNGGIVREIGQSLGLGEDDARKAVGQLAPALSRGISRNAQKPGGLEALLGAIQGGKHDRYVDQPETLSRPETISDGNKILGHIFGSKDVSRNVAGRASQETGIGADILKKMLPMVAAAVMGSMNKQASSAGLTGGGQQGGGGLLGQVMSSLGGGGQQGGSNSMVTSMLSSFLDSDKDGSVMDDLLDMGKKFF